MLHKVRQLFDRNRKPLEEVLTLDDAGNRGFLEGQTALVRCSRVFLWRTKMDAAPSDADGWPIGSRQVAGSLSCAAARARWTARVA
jgi:hypothetical protein